MQIESFRSAKWRFKSTEEIYIKFDSTLLSSGLHWPAGALLAGVFVAILIAGWPMLLALPPVLLAICVVSRMLP